MAETPHPSGLNRAQRRAHQRSTGGFGPSVRLDSEALRNRAMLQEERWRWCDGCQVTHHEGYCATCSKRQGKPRYHLLDDKGEFVEHR